MNVCTRPVTCAQGNSRFAQNSGRGAVARATPPPPHPSTVRKHRTSKRKGGKVREEMTLYAALRRSPADRGNSCRIVANEF